MNEFIDKIFEFFEKVISFIVSLVSNIFSNISNLIVYIWNLFITHPLSFIICVWLAYLIVRLFIDLIRELRFRKALIDTEMNIKYKFGYTMYIFGPIRVGKTTLMAALQNILTKELRNVAIKNIQSVKEQIIEVDYRKVDEILEECFFQEVFYKDAARILQERFPQLLTGSINDKINLKIDYIKLLERYVEAYYSLLRNNYVYSPKVLPIFNRITHTWSMKYEGSNLKLKEAYDNQDFNITRYSIICFDEKGLDQDKKNTSTFANASVDDGFNEALKIFGNAGKELMYLITTNQEYSQYLKSERTLFVSNIEVCSNRVLPRFKILMILITYLKNIVNFIYFWAKFFHFGSINRNSYVNKKNIFKRALRRLALWQSDVYSKAIIRYDIKLYKDGSSIGKENAPGKENYEELSLYFPVTYAFGNIDSHIYSFIFDELMDESLIQYYSNDVNSQDLSPEEKIDLVNNLLNRKEKAIEKKRNSKKTEEDLEIDNGPTFLK